MTVGPADSGQTLVAVPSKAGLIVYASPRSSLDRCASPIERSYEGRTDDLVTANGKQLALRWLNSLNV